MIQEKCRSKPAVASVPKEFSEAQPYILNLHGQKPHPIPLGWEQCGHGPRAGQGGHCQASDGDGFPQMFIQVSGFQSLLDAPPPLTLENCKGFASITDGQLSASSGLQSH